MHTARGQLRLTKGPGVSYGWPPPPLPAASPTSLLRPDFTSSFVILLAALPLSPLSTEFFIVCYRHPVFHPSICLPLAAYPLPSPATPQNPDLLSSLSTTAIYNSRCTLHSAILLHQRPNDDFKLSVVHLVRPPLPLPTLLFLQQLRPSWAIANASALSCFGLLSCYAL